MNRHPPALLPWSATGREPAALTHTGYDVIVVGAGLSGLETACSLRAAGADVFVLAGGRTADEDRWSSALPGHYREAPASRRGVGGRSLYWHGVVLRLEEWALRDPVWPSQAVEDLCGAGDRRGLYELVESELAEWAGAPLDAARGDGDAELAAVLAGVLAGPGGRVPRAVRETAAGWSAYTPLETWRRLPARRCLRARAEASMLLVRGGRAVGVRVRDARSGLPSVVESARVVLAAGTLENTRLVAQVLGDPDVEYVGLADHLVQGFLVMLPAEAFGLRAPAEGFAYAAGDAESRSNLFARVRPAGDGARFVLDVWAMGEQLPGAASRLAVERAASLPWAMRIEPGLSAADRVVLAAQRRLLAEVWYRLAAAVGVRPLALDFPDFLLAPRPFTELRPLEARRLPGRPVTYTWPLGSVDHESGTLPLGGRHVDVDGSVRGVDGLYVTGPATFPRAGAANPSLTTLALARRTARLLAER